MTLAASTHYVLTLNHMPVGDHDDAPTLIRQATREWAEMDEALA